MSNTVNKKVTRFFKETIARIKGDDATVLTLKNEKKAKLAFESQIIQHKLLIGGLEERIELAQEIYNTAKFPTILIGDAKRYVQEVLDAKHALETAEANLAKTKKDIADLEAVKEELSEEVDSE